MALVLVYVANGCGCGGLVWEGVVVVVSSGLLREILIVEVVVRGLVLALAVAV